MNCEVALILEHKYEQLQQMSDDPTTQISQYVYKSRCTCYVIKCSDIAILQGILLNTSWITCTK